MHHGRREVFGIRRFARICADADNRVPEAALFAGGCYHCGSFQFTTTCVHNLSNVKHVLGNGLQVPYGHMRRRIMYLANIQLQHMRRYVSSPPASMNSMRQERASALKQMRQSEGLVRSVSAWRWCSRTWRYVNRTSRSKHSYKRNMAMRSPS